MIVWHNLNDSMGSMTDYSSHINWLNEWMFCFCLCWWLGFKAATASRYDTISICIIILSPCSWLWNSCCILHACVSGKVKMQQQQHGQTVSMAWNPSPCDVIANAIQFHISSLVNDNVTRPGQPGIAMGFGLGLTEMLHKTSSKWIPAAYSDVQLKVGRKYFFSENIVGFNCRNINESLNFAF